MPEKRRLAAILVADVVGFSRLIGADESGTLARLAALRRDIADPLIAAHGGRIFKETGDGLLVEFGSAVQAVTCACAIQGRIDSEPLRLRIGIHLGDVVVQGSDLMGDGVNIAARLEGVAEPGGIALSRQVHDQVRDRLDVAFVDRGEIALKNIARPVQVFALASFSGARTESPTLPLPDKPSIAVLPFQNMSSDPEQEYFADGMVEDIITGLSRKKNLFVIARNSTFTYKGRAVDVKQVGRELGVRYVLEGSVRKAGNRVRITGQLIDATTGAHLWADRFEGQLDDIFDLQDHVTSCVVAALMPALEQAEIEYSRRKPTGSLKAYDFYLRGRMCNGKRTREGYLQAIHHYEKAVELDPEFALAMAEIAMAYSTLKSAYLSNDLVHDMAESVRLARCAFALDNTDARVLVSCGWVLAFVAGRLDEGSNLLDQALERDPNLFIAWNLRGWVGVMLGESSACERFERALRLNPLDNAITTVEAGLAHGHFVAARYADAASWATKVLQRMPAYAPAFNALVVSQAMAGNVDEARRVWATRPETLRNLRLSNLTDWFPAGPEVLERYAAAFRLAGVPE